MKMRLHGETEVGGLDPIGFTNPLDFRRHTPLIFEGEEVLNHRVAECDIDAAIGELGKIGCIACDRLDVLVSLLLGHKVHAEYLHIGTPRPAAIFPEGGLTPYVENSQRPGQRGDQGLEPLEASGAKLVRERVRVLAVGETTHRCHSKSLCHISAR
jgi:hypothetical protein